MKNFKILNLITVAGMILFASCSTIDQDLASIESVSERIDISIDGDMHELVYLQSDQNDNAVDLIDFNVHESSTTRMDIRVNIDAERTIVFRLTCKSQTTPWELASSYNIYTTQDLNDKDKYVTVDIVDQNPEGPTFSSNLGSTFPRETCLNVFNVVDYDPVTKEMFCRIIDLPLINNNGQDMLSISGTFYGAVTFLD